MFGVYTSKGKSDGGVVRRRRGSGDSHRSKESERDVEAGGDKDRRPKVRRRVRTDDMKVTFENIISYLGSMKTSELDKDSVTDLVKDVYTWMVFDPNGQISMPVAPGEKKACKMWAHGAVVDSRRSGPFSPENGDPRMLEELNADVASTVATSVVSSTIEEEKLVGHMGNITFDTPHHPQSQQLAPFVYQHRESNHVRRPDNFPPSIREEDGEDIHEYMHKPVPVRSASTAANHIPRYSILGGAPAPVNVPDSPDASKVKRPTNKAQKPRARVGAVPRRNNTEGGGIPVTFADDE